METVFPKAMRILLIEDHPDSRRNLRSSHRATRPRSGRLRQREEAEAELAKDRLSRF